MLNIMDFLLGIVSRCPNRARHQVSASTQTPASVITIAIPQNRPTSPAGQHEQEAGGPNEPDTTMKKGNVDVLDATVFASRTG